MYWQEETQPAEYQVPDDVIDLVFDIQCRELPVDHAYALGHALTNALPTLKENNNVAIHNIHLAGSQNGWERPDPALGQKLIPSKRTKLSIRVPKQIKEQVSEALNGVSINIDGDQLTIGKAKSKSLSKQGTLFSRQIMLQEGEAENENAFLMRMVKELSTRGIKVKKALCGVTQTINTPEGMKPTRSLMLAELSPEEAIKLQQEGIGEHCHIGCGIFIPHKGIDAVKKQGDE